MFFNFFQGFFLSSIFFFRLSSFSFYPLLLFFLRSHFSRSSLPNMFYEYFCISFFLFIWRLTNNVICRNQDIYYIFRMDDSMKVFQIMFRNWEVKGACSIQHLDFIIAIKYLQKESRPKYCSLLMLKRRGRTL